MRKLNLAAIFCTAIAGVVFVTGAAFAGDNVFPLPSGNVGIGTTSPQYTLDVNGTFRVRNGHQGQIDVGSWGHEFYFTDGTHNKLAIRTWDQGVSGSDAVFIDMRNEAGEVVNRVATNSNSWIKGGNLGIGTSSKINNKSNSRALTIYGGDSENTAAVEVAGHSDFGNTALSRLYLGNTAGNFFSLTSIEGRTGTNSNDGELAFYTSNDNVQAEAMRIDEDGRVGIGTTNPSELLHLKHGNTGGLRIESDRQDDPRDWRLISNYRGANQGTAFEIYDLTAGTSRFLIDKGGNVGIGTTNPQSKLAVNGTITAKEVKVTNVGWSDYVFADNYDLKSLDEVESYIKENKHLPDIPAGKKLEDDGVDVSQMLSLQMKKIEELTLYLIELKKDNTELKTQVAELQARPNQ